MVYSHNQIIKNDDFWLAVIRLLLIDSILFTMWWVLIEYASAGFQL